MVFPWQLNSQIFKPWSFQFRATPIEVKLNKGLVAGNGRETGTHQLQDRSGRHDDVCGVRSPHFPGIIRLAFESPTRLQRGSQGSFYDIMTSTKRVRRVPASRPRGCGMPLPWQGKFASSGVYRGTYINSLNSIFCRVQYSKSPPLYGSHGLVPLCFLKNSSVIRSL